MIIFPYQLFRQKKSGIPGSIPINIYGVPGSLERNTLVDLLKSQDWSLITNFKSRYIERLRQYYYVGGMPEAVLAFSQRTDFDEIRDIQKRILIAYEQDFSKHAPSEIVPRLRMLWNSIPAQLAKENRKFIYGLIRHGARAKDYKMAMSWLIDCGLIHKINYYRAPENARAEIGFLLQSEGKIIPIEVKAAENLQAKSLRVFHQKFQPELSLRVSLSDFRKEDWLTNWPLYAINVLSSEAPLY